MKKNTALFLIAIVSILAISLSVVYPSHDRDRVLYNFGRNFHDVWNSLLKLIFGGLAVVALIAVIIKELFPKTKTDVTTSGCD